MTMGESSSSSSKSKQRYSFYHQPQYKLINNYSSTGSTSSRLTQNFEAPVHSNKRHWHAHQNFGVKSHLFLFSIMNSIKSLQWIFLLLILLVNSGGKYQ